MKQYHIYQSTAAGLRFTETEIQPREYAGFVYADSLEEAYENAQNDNEEWAFNEKRSTSVGDVIQAEDGFYLVCGMGFKLLDDTSENDHKLNSFESLTYE